jgi:hypothetical protein
LEPLSTKTLLPSSEKEEGEKNVSVGPHLAQQIDFPAHYFYLMTEVESNLRNYPVLFDNIQTMDKAQTDNLTRTKWYSSFGSVPPTSHTL